ncbi:hypothetical protein [Streptomyces atratus]
MITAALDAGGACTGLTTDLAGERRLPPLLLSGKPEVCTDPIHQVTHA